MPILKIALQRPLIMDIQPAIEPKRGSFVVGMMIGRKWDVMLCWGVAQFGMCVKTRKFRSKHYSGKQYRAAEVLRGSTWQQIAWGNMYAYRLSGNHFKMVTTAELRVLSDKSKATTAVTRFT